MMDGGLYLLDIFELGCEIYSSPHKLGLQLSFETLSTVRGSDVLVGVQLVGPVKAALVNVPEMSNAPSFKFLSTPSVFLDSVR